MGWKASLKTARGRVHLLVMIVAIAIAGLTPFNLAFPGRPRLQLALAIAGAAAAVLNELGYRKQRAALAENQATTEYQ